MNTQSPWDEPGSEYDPSYGQRQPQGDAGGISMPPDASYELPKFCKGIAIADLVMASIRLLIVPLSIIGYMVIPDDDPVKQTAIAEIAFGLMIGVNGIVANIAMLMKKPWAVAAGWLNVGVTFAGIGFAIIQVMVMMGGPEAKDTAVQAGMFIGAAFASLIRGTLAVMVTLAILRYKTWLKSWR